jgi:dimethylglycine dehydrogenase
LSVRRAEVGLAPATIMAVSFSGEDALEVHVPLGSLDAAWRALRAAGALTLFGARAAQSMRLEKSFLHWKADIVTEFDPDEAGLSRFVRQGGGYIGAEALAVRRARGPSRSLVTLSIKGSDAPTHPGASVKASDRVIGTVTSAALGHRTGLNLALAYVAPGSAEIGTALAVDLVGVPHAATVIAPSPYDPGYTRLR